MDWYPYKISFPFTLWFYEAGSHWMFLSTALSQWVFFYEAVSFTWFQMVIHTWKERAWKFIG